MKRSQPKRDWTDAEQKRTACRRCGSYSNVELDHIIGRACDRPKKPGNKTLWVNPDSVWPLCGPYPEGCHGAKHRREFDCLPLLTTEEQAQAVLDSGSIESARIRLCPSAYSPQQEPVSEGANGR